MPLLGKRGRFDRKRFMGNEMTYKIKACLVCGSDRLVTEINLGDQPLANNLKTDQFGLDELYPLEVMECLFCSHKQLTVAVDPKILFSNYLYKTGVSKEHNSFFEDFAGSLIVAPNFLDPEWKVLDIGCNDGTLLTYFKNLGWKVQGIEPAINLAKEVAAKGIPVINDFFPPLMEFPFRENG